MRFSKVNEYKNVVLLDPIPTLNSESSLVSYEKECFLLSCAKVKRCNLSQAEIQAQAQAQVQEVQVQGSSVLLNKTTRSALRQVQTQAQRLYILQSLHSIETRISFIRKENISIPKERWSFVACSFHTFITKTFL